VDAAPTITAERPRPPYLRCGVHSLTLKTKWGAIWERRIMSVAFGDKVVPIPNWDFRPVERSRKSSTTNSRWPHEVGKWRGKQPQGGLAI